MNDYWNTMHRQLHVTDHDLSIITVLFLFAFFGISSTRLIQTAKQRVGFFPKANHSFVDGLCVLLFRCNFACSCVDATSKEQLLRWLGKQQWGDVSCCIQPNQHEQRFVEWRDMLNVGRALQGVKGNTKGALPFPYTDWYFAYDMVNLVIWCHLRIHAWCMVGTG